MMEQQITKAIWTAIGLLIGFVGYYLKKRDARIDANDIVVFLCKNKIDFKIIKC